MSRRLASVAFCTGCWSTAIGSAKTTSNAGYVSLGPPCFDPAGRARAAYASVDHGPGVPRTPPGAWVQPARGPDQVPPGAPERQDRVGARAHTARYGCTIAVHARISRCGSERVGLIFRRQSGHGLWPPFPARWEPPTGNGFRQLGLSYKVDDSSNAIGRRYARYAAPLQRTVRVTLERQSGECAQTRVGESAGGLAQRGRTGHPVWHHSRLPDAQGRFSDPPRARYNQASNPSLGAPPSSIPRGAPFGPH